jgi:hypothetical protein
VKKTKEILGVLILGLVVSFFITALIMLLHYLTYSTPVLKDSFDQFFGYMSEPYNLKLYIGLYLVISVIVIFMSFEEDKK